MKNLDERFKNLVSDMDIDLKKRARQASAQQEAIKLRSKRIKRALPDLQVAETLAYDLPIIKTKKKNNDPHDQEELLKRWARLHNIPSDVKVNMKNLDKIIQKLHIKEAKEKGLKKPAKMRKPPKTLIETSPEAIEAALPPIQQAFLKERLDRLGQGMVMRKLKIYQEMETKRRINERMKHIEEEIDRMDITRREKAVMKREAKQNIEKQIMSDIIDITKSAVDNMMTQQTAARLPIAPKHKIALQEQAPVKKPRRKKDSSDQKPPSIRFSWGSLRGSFPT